MNEPDPFRHVPDSIKDAIPEPCSRCPALLGSLSVHNEFIDSAIRHRAITWNPIKKLTMIIARKLSDARLYSDLHERTLNMRDCEGTIEYPANANNPAILCGLDVRETINEQISNQSLRTQ